MRLELITREPETDARPTPILFIHGSWHAAWCWEERFLTYFASKGYVSHAMSLRGHGNSEGYDHLFWTSMRDYATDVAQVVDEMGEQPVLVGHSMGGMVVQKYLETRSAPAAVLMASLPKRGSSGFALRTARRHPLRFLKFLVTLNSYHALGSLEAAHEMLFSADMDQDQVAKYFPCLQKESFRAVLDAFFLDLPRPRKVGKTPMIVLGAAEDKVFTVKEQEATARAYGLRAEIFPGMAHDMMLENNWQQVADRIIDWLQGLGL